MKHDGQESVFIVIPAFRHDELRQHAINFRHADRALLEHFRKHGVLIDLPEDIRRERERIQRDRSSAAISIAWIVTPALEHDGSIAP